MKVLLFDFQSFHLFTVRYHYPMMIYGHGLHAMFLSYIIASRCSITALSCIQAFINSFLSPNASVFTFHHIIACSKSSCE